MISMRFDLPSQAAACAGSHGTVAMRGAMRMTVPFTAVATMAVPSSTVLSITVPSTKVPWLDSPQRERQGRSVATGTRSVARKAEVRPRHAATNDGYVVLIDDVWGPDPWRPQPV